MMSADDLTLARTLLDEAKARAAARKSTVPSAARANETGVSNVPESTACAHPSQQTLLPPLTRRSADDLAAEIAERLRPTIRFYGGEFQRLEDGEWVFDLATGGDALDELARISHAIGRLYATGTQQQRNRATRERLRLESSACFTSVRARLRKLLAVSK